MMSWIWIWEIPLLGFWIDCIALVFGMFGEHIFLAFFFLTRRSVYMRHECLYISIKIVSSDVSVARNPTLHRIDCEVSLL